jgi:hypothetical protein
LIILSLSFIGNIQIEHIFVQYGVCTAAHTPACDMHVLMGDSLPAWDRPFGHKQDEALSNSAVFLVYHSAK